MKNKPTKSWIIWVLATPEVNLFLFAFLINFVYEVWQAPYYEFYGKPTLLDKIKDLTHCSFGDGVITLISAWIVSMLARSRRWMINPTLKFTLLFTSVGLIITLVIETYRVNVTKTYGVPVFAVPVLGMSWLAVFQWIILPPLVLYLSHRQMLGYRKEQ
ncbi:hypothetical protein DSM106972_066520 [Dulcicalothrix desertica PCC 7102]|uniref:Uncharacterized protein n=1 Tax=Dulcicalothrix desertica PCC 7102 TaxID=232991 RepID=A0A3S1D0W5_9CYAN|nr:hypothetical protein [Dulcicalothrix desertica]RUT01555.1 hypothetical protein DSM106972_066520 [Dulcicalothrix desertica PCC 7102]